MDKDLKQQGWNEQIASYFNLETKDIRTYSPLTLAYIGDCIFDLVIRSILVDKGNAKNGMLHEAASKIVSAKKQAHFYEIIKPLLTETEADVLRRGKNAKPYSHAKNATLNEYHKATGLEAVLGYLYLTNQNERILELVKALLKGDMDER